LLSEENWRQPRARGPREALAQGKCHRAQATKLGIKAHQCISAGYVSVTRPIKTEIAEVIKNVFVIDEVFELMDEVSRAYR
jgi:hypothetical protein